MSPFCRNMAPKKIKWLTIKWVGNNSPKYDGVVHLIDAKHVHPDDAANMEVGRTVRVKWGGRTWRGEVVVMPQHFPDNEQKAASPVPPESQPQVAVVGKSKNKQSLTAPKSKQSSSSAPKAKATKPRRAHAEQSSATKLQRKAEKGK